MPGWKRADCGDKIARAELIGKAKAFPVPKCPDCGDEMILITDADAYFDIPNGAVLYVCHWDKGSQIVKEIR